MSGTDIDFMADVIEQTIQGHSGARCIVCPTVADAQATALAHHIAYALVALGYDLPAVEATTGARDLT